VVLAAAVGALTVALATSDDLRHWLKVEETAIRWGAGLSGGAAITLFVVAAWTWIGRLKWVAVSPAGLRWYSGRRVRARHWEEYIRVHRAAVQMSVFGQEMRAGQYAEVEFRDQKSLRIAPETIHGYEDLIAEIQTTSLTSAHRAFAPAARVHGAGDPELVTFGPLGIDADGLAWEGTHRRWDEIENYEVAVGYLRIQPVGGPEFLRRLMEMGDWQKAVARLDKEIGNKRVGRPVAVAVR
jgi:hypothetical protein